MIATAERILEVTDDSLVRVRARGAIGFARQRIGDLAAAVEACDAALAELGDTARDDTTVAVRLQLLADKAQLLFLQGHYIHQAAIGAEMLPLAEALGTPRALQDAH